MSHQTYKEDVVLITPQSIFNAAWQRFIIEKRPPCIKDVQCAYEHNGNNCAVGAAMTREQLNQIKEQGDDHETADNLAIKYPDWFKGEITTFYEIQKSLHDSLVDFDNGLWRYPFETIEKQYREVASTFDLTIPEETDVQEG